MVDGSLATKRSRYHDEVVARAEKAFTAPGGERPRRVPCDAVALPALSEIHPGEQAHLVVGILGYGVTFPGRWAALVLTLVGYWVGRYGETTGRDRAHAPFLSIAVVTVLYEFGLLVVHFVLGESAPAGAVVRSLVPAIVLNLILTAPIYALVRRLLRPVQRDELTAEVQLLG